MQEEPPKLTLKIKKKNSEWFTVDQILHCWLLQLIVFLWALPLNCIVVALVYQSRCDWWGVLYLLHHFYGFQTEIFQVHQPGLALSQKRIISDQICSTQNIQAQYARTKAQLMNLLCKVPDILPPFIMPKNLK